MRLGSSGGALGQPWGEAGIWDCKRGHRDVIGVMGWTDGGWGLCCSPPHTLVGCFCWFSDALCPVFPSPGSHVQWFWVEFRGAQRSSLCSGQGHTAAVP